MWKYIELALGMAAVTAIAFMRLSSGRFFFAIDAFVLFLGVAIMLGVTIGGFVDAFAGWASAIAYLAIVASIVVASMKRNQKDEQKRAWRRWVKGGPYS